MKEPLDLGRPHSFAPAAFHQTAAHLHAEVYRRSLKGQPMSDVSAQVEQLICRVRAALEEWDGLSRSSSALTRLRGHHRVAGKIAQSL
jgi:hypothetical protein